MALNLPWSQNSLDTRLKEASNAYAVSLRGATRTALLAEDVGWKAFGSDESTSDVVPLEVVKSHSIRSRRLASYNPLVKRGIGIRNAYMWTTLPTLRNVTGPTLEKLQGPLLSLQARQRDESAFCTDGIVLYLVNRTSKTAAPVPLRRIRGIARAQDASDEGDIYAFLIDAVPVSDQIAPDLPDPKWYVVDGKEYTTIRSSDGYETDRSSTVVYEMVNRQTGEQWGKPDLMGAVYWAQAYKEYLEAAHTMAKALARVAFKTTSSTSRQQQAVMQQLSGAQGVGGIASLGMGQDLSAVSKAGAGIEFSAGTPLAAMVSASLDVPLSVLLTDGSAGGRQGAESALEEPTFKAFESRRQIHADLILRVARALAPRAEVALVPLDNELIQRWGQVVTLGVQNGLLHQVEARQLFLDRFKPINGLSVDDLPETPTAVGAPTGYSATGVGPLSDGTNANRDEDGGETVA